MLEVGVRMRTQDPAVWVPELAIVLDRYRDNATASQMIMMNLIDLGLMRVVPSPDNPGQMMVDPRTLQALMQKYGPRVTTASGQLGVSATKGAIWTPESATAGQPSAIWTPGSTPPPAAGEKPKLILGR
jgi:hypothetical protein